jgi:outer membrane biosynthesis protein TonB
MSKTQTKTEIRNNTAKIGKLLRGIDNDTLAIKKDQAKLNVRIKAVQDSAKTVQTLIGGISNMALAAPASLKKVQFKKPEPKTASKVSPKAPKAPKKPTPKKAATKTAAPKKDLKKATKAPAAVKASTSESPQDRPSLKKVITDIILKNGKPMGAADIYKIACQKFGYWSRQSLYNALKDNKAFAKKGEGYDVPDSSPISISETSDSEAEKFVQRVEGNSATSAVV